MPATKRRQPSPFHRHLVSVDDAAEYLGVHAQTVRSFIHRGKLTGYKVGRLMRVDAAEVERLAEPVPTVRAAGGDAA
ncbi:hypothetical protein GCM10009547_48570 [Sporichthya brevicatena]|uniref:Helix-turn-helix domain-containing protein n=1 Tax=Sporichthya brevicatena TaxID=171442 RepID=A0ABP3SH02_9ACTN